MVLIRFKPMAVIFGSESRPPVWSSTAQRGDGQCWNRLAEGLGAAGVVDVGVREHDRLVAQDVDAEALFRTAGVKLDAHGQLRVLRRKVRNEQVRLPESADRRRGATPYGKEQFASDEFQSLGRKSPDEGESQEHGTRHADMVSLR